MGQSWDNRGMFSPLEEDLSDRVGWGGTFGAISPEKKLNPIRIRQRISASRLYECFLFIIIIIIMSVVVAVDGWFTSEDFVGIIVPQFYEIVFSVDC